MNIRAFFWRLFFRLFGPPPVVEPLPVEPGGSRAPAGPRRGGGSGTVRGDDDLCGVKILDVVAFNAEVEPQAVALWASMLRERGTQRVGTLCVEAAFRFDVSTETAKRWLLKHSAESAEFVIQRGVVSLRER